MYASGVFCHRVVGWIVIAHALWCNVLLPTRGDDVCLITQGALSESAAVVAANDGRVYDAFALREWIRTCRAMRRVPPHVIEGQPITRVRPVRVVAGGVSKPWRRRTRTVDVATQTESVRAVRRANVTIPSTCSAFTPWSRDARGTC